MMNLQHQLTPPSPLSFSAAEEGLPPMTKPSSFSAYDMAVAKVWLNQNESGQKRQHTPPESANEKENGGASPPRSKARVGRGLTPRPQSHIATQPDDPMECEAPSGAPPPPAPPVHEASATEPPLVPPPPPSAPPEPPADAAAELVRSKETADLGGQWWALAGTPLEADVVAIKADALSDLKARKRVRVVGLVPPESGSELLVDYKVKGGEKMRRLPARFLTAPTERKKPSAASRPVGPIFREPSEEELLPLEVAAERELPATKELLADLLTGGVEKGSLLETAIRQHPYASALAIRRRNDLGVEHWPTGSAAMLDHAALMFRLTGLPAHLSPPPLAMPEGLGREAYSRFVFLHYPPPPAAEHGYVKPDGHPPDATTRLLERAVQTALKRLGIDYLWGAQYHGMFDLCGSAHATKVVITKEDGSEQITPFDFGRDFWDPLDHLDQWRWYMSMVKVLAAVMVDEITVRGRVGARCLITGSNPRDRWPGMITDAVALAKKATSQSYEIEIFEGQHPSKVYAPGGIDKPGRKQLDAAVQSVHAETLPDGVSIDYFTNAWKVGHSEKPGDWEVGDEWTEEVRILQEDAKALEGGYDGPSPLDATLKAAQQADRKAAISRGASMRARGGKELVEKAEAGDEAAQAKSKAKAKAGTSDGGSTHYDQSKADPTRSTSEGKAAGGGCNFSVTVNVTSRPDLSSTALLQASSTSNAAPRIDTTSFKGPSAPTTTPAAASTPYPKPFPGWRDDGVWRAFVDAMRDRSVGPYVKGYEKIRQRMLPHVAPTPHDINKAKRKWIDDALS